jgi:hypothetical protein
LCLFINFYSEQVIEAESHNFSIKYKVVDVVALDRIKLSNGQTINLYGVSKKGFELYQKDFTRGFDPLDVEIAEPGISQSFFEGISVEEIYNQNIKLIRNLVLNKSVNIRKTNNDKYLVYLGYFSKQSLNQQILEQGILELDSNLIGDEEDNNLILAENSAKDEELGIWKIKILSLVKTPPGHGDIGIDPKIVVSIIFFITLVCFVVVVRNKSILGLMTFFLCDILGLSFGFINYDSSLSFLGLSIFYNSVILILFILLYIFYIIDRIQMSLLFVFLSIFLFIIYIIFFFGIIYFNISNTQYTINKIEYLFPKMELSSSNPNLPITNYLNTTDAIYNLYKYSSGFYNLNFIDSLYFSASTFLTGAYGDIVPKGSLKWIAMSELFFSYLLQLLLFALIVSKISAIISYNKKADFMEAQSDDFFSPDLTRKDSIRLRRKQRWKK